ncbi:MAG: hypothetical protein J1E34_01830 [Oscillospiraceae bacterium]|nr:hypothetical protein [Oscillospiraceae bacterium]
MADNNNFLPDISGVFDIDESRIPSKIIEKQPEEKRKSEPARSILLSNDIDKKQLDKTEKKKQKDRRKLQKKKAMKKRLYISAFALIVIAALALVIRAAVLNGKKPVVNLEQVARETITAHYDAEASILSEDGENYSLNFYAVFVENDYDVYGLQKGQRAVITLSEGDTVTGVVADIKKEDSDSGIVSKLMNILSGGSYLAASNYTVYISLDDTSNILLNTAVNVTITTGIAENTLTVPSDAVFKDGSQYYVWVYKSFGKKLRRQDVTLGLETDGRTEIKKGLSEEDLILKSISGENTDLYDNIKVRLSTD